MAKNWKVGEAVRAIKGGNREDMMDIGRRFPLFSMLAAQTNEAGVQLLDCVPDYVSARKMESVLKGDVAEKEDVEDEIEDEEPKDNKKAPKGKAGKGKAKEVEPDEDEDEGESLKDKSAKELFDMCKEAGIKVKPKQDKKVYIKALEEANESEDDEDDWGEEEEPKKEAKKDKKAGKGKDKKKAKDEEEDDEDWDI